MTNAPFEKSHAKALGDQLRWIRNETGLSLMGVEEKSAGKWKAVVIGSYERGNRAITVIRLIELAAFYGVQPADLLPKPELPELGVVEETERLLRAAADRLATLLPTAEPSLSRHHADAVAGETCTMPDCSRWECLS